MDNAGFHKPNKNKELIELIELIKLKSQFNYYEDLKYADGKKIYTMSMKLYPCNIKINSIVETWEQKKNNSKEKNYVILLHDYLFKNESALNNLSYFISLLKKNINPKFKWANEYPGMQ